MTSELEAGKFQRLRAELIEVSTRLLAAALSTENSSAVVPVTRKEDREKVAARYTDLAAKLLDSCEAEAFAQCGKGPG